MLATSRPLETSATPAVRALFPLVSLQLLLFPLWILALSAALLVRPRPAGESSSGSRDGADGRASRSRSR